MKKIGIVGYGSLGKFLTEKIIADPDLELAFIYNRDIAKVKNDIPESKVLSQLDEFIGRDVDLIVEVAHPDISQKYATALLQKTNYMIGSPTAMACKNLEDRIYSCLKDGCTGKLYIPRGAMWYLERVLQMSADNKLQEVHVTMKKHPLSINYCGPLDTPLAEITEETVIYQGNARKLCSYAPNNVNTIAVAALAAKQVGLDNTVATLVADPNLEAHIIEIVLYGPGEEGNRYFEKAYRYNPAKKGAVTGSATYHSFFTSLKKACTITNPNIIEFC